MEPHATYDDVNLILKLYELRREEKMRQARDWLFKFKPTISPEEFLTRYPPGSDGNAYFRMVTTYWDMAASFVTSGVLNQELFLQSGLELLFVWEKVRDLVPGWRETAHNPKILANLEKVAGAAADYMNRGNPDGYKKFSDQVRGIGG